MIQSKTVGLNFGSNNVIGRKRDRRTSEQHITHYNNMCVCVYLVNI